MAPYVLLLKLFLAIFLFFVFASLWGFYSSIRPPRILSSLTPADIGLDYEEVSFETADGLTLRGWFVPHGTEREKAIVLLHGYPADKGDILPAAAFLAERYPLLLFDFRYFGKSGGWMTTAGVREADDARAAVRYLTSRGFLKVGILGFSMGGAAGLMAAPHLPEVKAIATESAYASLGALTPELYRVPMLRDILAMLTRFWARVFLAIDARAVSPAQEAARLTIPVLVMHSKNDRVIPFSHALVLQEALAGNPSAEFWFSDELGHGELAASYEERVGAFFRQHL